MPPRGDMLPGLVDEGAEFHHAAVGHWRAPALADRILRGVIGEGQRGVTGRRSIAAAAVQPIRCAVKDLFETWR
jgi:hypothetical protein